MRKKLFLATVMVLLTVSMLLLNIPVLEASDGQQMDTYISNTYGYSISYPQGSRVDDSDPSFVGFILDEVTRTVFIAFVEPLSVLPASVTSLDDLETFRIKQVKEQDETASVEVISSKKVRQDEKFPGREVLLKYTDQGIDYRTDMLLVMSDKYSFMVTATTQAKLYDTYEPQFHAAIESFTVDATIPRITSTPASTPALTQTNLLRNPGAEEVQMSASGGQVVSIPGWTITSNFTTEPYGGDFPTTAESQRISGGSNLFSGGPENAMSTATQEVDVSSLGQDIDAARRTAVLQAQLAGYGNQGDNGTVKAEFLSASGALLGSISVGPVGGTNNVFQFKTASGAVPSGTRSVRVTMTSTRFNGSYNDGYFDNLFLGLQSIEVTPIPSSTPAPVGTSTPTVTPTVTTAGARLIVDSRSVAPGGKVQVPVRLENVGNIGSMNFVLTYDPGVLKVTKVDKGSLLSGAMFTPNYEDPPVILFGFASNNGLSGSGSVAYIEFVAIGSEGSKSPLTVSEVLTTDISGQSLLLSTQNGTVTIDKDENRLLGDYNGDSRVTEVDALAALRMSVKLLAEDLIVDMNQDGKVTAEDARLILKQAVTGETTTGKTTVTPTPVPATTLTSTLDEKTIAAIKEETNKVIKKASEAMLSGNVEGLLNELESSLKAQLAGDLNLSAPKTAAVAEALSNAKVTEVYPDMVFYEMAIDSETYSFYVLREGQEWKIGGL